MGPVRPGFCFLCLCLISLADAADILEQEDQLRLGAGAEPRVPGNFWDAPVSAGEQQFIDKLKAMAGEYGLKMRYDIMWGSHYYLPHEGAMWHLQVPTELAYSTGLNAESDDDWNHHKAVVSARNMRDKVLEKRVSDEDLQAWLAESPGHMFITDNNPTFWGWTFNLTYIGKTSYRNKAYVFMHGIDEDGVYFGNGGVGEYQPLCFSKYFLQNMYATGPRSKDEFMQLAGFTDGSKPLLVYLATYDDNEDPEKNPENPTKYRPASVVFVAPDYGTDFRALFDLGELRRLADTYNVVLRPHPSVYKWRARSHDVLQQLRDLDADPAVSFFLDTGKEVDYVEWYAPADVIVAEISATLTGALALAKEKPLVLARRMANEEKLKTRAKRLLQDDACTAWRPEKEESLVDAVAAAVKSFEDAGNKDAIVKRRTKYNEMIYRCPLTGYEEYGIMVALLERLKTMTGEAWRSDVQELKDLYLKSVVGGAKWCDPLPPDWDKPKYRWLLWLLVPAAAAAGLVVACCRRRAPARAASTAAAESEQGKVEMSTLDAS